jgi:hypothetical protein
LGRAPTVQHPRFAGNSAFKRGAKKVGFQLDGGEARCAFRKRHYATIAASGIRQRDNCRGVKVSVWGQVLFGDIEPAPRITVLHVKPI